jgi:hypothetical protein
MIKWFRRSAKKRRGADAERDPAKLSRQSTRTSRQRQTTKRQTHRKGLPPDPSGGFDGNQDFITRYGDPFDG